MSQRHLGTVTRASAAAPDQGLRGAGADALNGVPDLHNRPVGVPRCRGTHVDDE